jgi:hypothetical protein
VTATVKIAVEPARAAVFVDGLYVGHAKEFEGMGRGMEVAPGMHKIRFALPGYQVFETDIDPIANQKVEIKTQLSRTNGTMGAPLVEKSSTTSSAPDAKSTTAVGR